jgi:hypothetical protein
VNIGKCLVNRIGTRVRGFVVERPVEGQVSLYTENVVLEGSPFRPKGSRNTRTAPRR